MSRARATPSRKSFTPTSFPKLGAGDWRDANSESLILRVSPKGHRSFSVLCRAPVIDAEGNGVLDTVGKLKRRVTRFTMPLGRTATYEDVGPARRWATNITQDCRDGKHPDSSNRQARAKAANEKSIAAMTVRSAVEAYLDWMAKSRRANTVSKAEYYLRTLLLGQTRERKRGAEWQGGNGWSARLVTEIESAEIDKVLEKVRQNSGGPAANRAKASITAFWTWLLKRKREYPGVEPLALLYTPSEERPRDRLLAADEVAAIWNASRDAGIFGQAVRLLLLTGQRRDEVVRAEWAEIVRDEWIVPAARYKGKRDHLVPLVPAALDLLDAIRKDQEKREIGDTLYLFSIEGRTPIAAIGKLKSKLEVGVAARLGRVPDRWTLHDLRRAVGTYLEEVVGVKWDLVGAVLGHSQEAIRGVTSRYVRQGVHARKVEKRAALLAWSRLLALIVEGAPISGIMEPRTQSDVAARRAFQLAVADDEPVWLEWRAGLKK